MTALKIGGLKLTCWSKKRRVLSMSRRFYHWVRWNSQCRFETMYHSFVASMSQRLENIKSDIQSQIPTQVLANEAVASLNKELLIVRDEQFRVIEEYQRKVLSLDIRDQKRPTIRSELAKQVLLSREKEIVNARAEVRILKEELQLLGDRVRHFAMLNSPSGGAGLTTLGLLKGVDGKERALRIVISEVNRLSDANAGLDTQLKILGGQVSFTM